jgi:hypothetical protein
MGAPGRPLQSLVGVLPGLGLAFSLLILAIYCRDVLLAAATGVELPDAGADFWLAVGGFLVASATVVLVAALRLSRRVTGPEYRLRLALQRIRSCDVGFRITLRRGDLLHGLARECNELLDWLNENPPAGMKTGSDVVEVTPLEQDKPLELEKVAP